MIDKKKIIPKRGRMFTWECSECLRINKVTVYVLLDCLVKCIVCGRTYKVKAAKYLPVSKVIPMGGI